MRSPPCLMVLIASIECVISYTNAIPSFDNEIFPHPGSIVLGDVFTDLETVGADVGGVTAPKLARQQRSTKASFHADDKVLPQVEALEENTSSPKVSGDDTVVEQFSAEEAELDHQLHTFQELVNQHIDSNHAVCKDPNLARQISSSASKDVQSMHQNSVNQDSVDQVVNNAVGTTAPRMEEAVMTVTKSAEWGDAQSQFSLAFAFEMGLGVHQDSMQALKWYQVAAAQDFQAAIINLGVMYFQGRGGVEKNAEKALLWFRKAAHLGNINGMHMLGAMYRDGLGVEVDVVKSAALFRRGAKLGDHHAQFSLGKAYADGHGVIKNDKIAASWFTKAAEAGNSGAQTNLGVFYSLGRGVDKNPKVARKWLLKAAAQGNAFAQLNIGVAYMYGTGVSKDATKAARWFLKSAQQGLTAAQFNIGELYKKGIGVEQDIAKAKYWLAKSGKEPKGTLHLHRSKV